MSEIEWKDGAVCYGDGRQWFVNTGSDSGKFELVNNDGSRKYSLYGILNFPKDFQLNEIKVGDYLPKSELDTEKKYNDVVEVFRLFGFNGFMNVNDYSTAMGDVFELIYIKDTRFMMCNKHANLKRKLTYHQIIAIGKLKRMMLERAVPAVEFGVVADNGNPDQVKNPKHYQLIEGVESIEIIARSMTKEQWKGFCLGNMLKYRIRAGKKDALQQDIEKANFYGELYEMHKEKCYD